MNTIQEYEIGNCLNLLPSIPDKSVNLILTDLPYGQTACKWDSIIDLSLLWPEYKRILTNNGAIVLTCTFKFGVALVNSNPEMFRYDLVWEKTRATGFLNANRMPMRNHEMILVFYNHLPTFNPQYTQGEAYTRGATNKTELYQTNPDFIQDTFVDIDTRNPVSVIKPDNLYGIEHGFNDVSNHEPAAKGQRLPVSIVKHANGNNTTIHPTQKPLSLWEYIIRTYTNPGDMVHDSCLGAGTTLEACVNLNRNCMCFELEDDWEWNYKKILESSKDKWKLSKIFGKELS